MKNILRPFAGAMALFATLAVLGKFYAVPAIAQAVRAAAVKNIDERGRIPYGRQVTGNAVNTSSCDAIFPAVPANKLLVVEYVNGAINPVSGIGIDEVFMNTQAGSNALRLSARLEAAASLGSGAKYSLNQPIIAYFDSAHQPPLVAAQLVGAISAGSNAVCTFTLTGYLVDLTQ